jgi:hypothetical protein
MFREIVSGFIGSALSRAFRAIPHPQVPRLWLATRRFGQLLLPLGLLIITLAPPRIYDVRPESIFPLKGYAYSLDLSNVDHWGDSSARQQQSRLVLFENGRALGPVHSLHADIMEKGSGRLSHWHNVLYFSASDNSDPRANGRTYRVIARNMPIERLGWLVTGLGLAALVWPLFARRSVRAAIGRRRTVMALSVLGGASGVLGVAILFGLVGGDPSPTNEQFLSLPSLRLAQPDLMVFGGSLVLGACLGWLHGGWNGTRVGAFAGAAAAVLVVINAVLLGSGPFWAVLGPDSSTYFGFNACRTPGYYVFLQPFMDIDPRWLVVVQLNLLIGALIAVAAGCAYVTASTLVGIATLFLGLAFGSQFVYAFYVLTEATFMAALGIAIAAALAYLRSPRLWSAVVVGVAIAIALAIKASAPVLLISAALLLLLPATRRSLKAAALVGIPALCLLTLMTVGRISHGSWSPTNYMGFAFVGHVAYGIIGDELASNPELSARIHSEIRGFHEKWPPINQLDDYVRMSQNDYNEMLWGHLYPIVVRSLPPQTIACSKEINDTLMTLAKEAVLRFPGRYLGHVGAHYYGLWSYALVPTPFNQTAAWQRQNAAATQQDIDKIPRAWQASSAQIAALKESAAVVGARSLFFGDVQVDLARAFGTGTAILIGLGATIAALGMFVLPHLRRDIAALVVVAGFVVPYFAVNSLFQVALDRYTTTAEFGIAAFVTLTGFVLISRLWKLLSAYVLGEARSSRLTEKLLFRAGSASAD